MSVLLGSQYAPLDAPESKYSTQIEPDQEVAAVLCSGNLINPSFLTIIYADFNTCFRHVRSDRPLDSNYFL